MTSLQPGRVVGSTSIYKPSFSVALNHQPNMSVYDTSELTNINEQTTAMSHIFKNLLSGVEYLMWMTASNSAGSSHNTSVKTVRLRENSECYAPNNLH